LIDGWESMGFLAGDEGRAAMVQQLIYEREHVYGGGEPTMIPVVDNSGGPAALGTPDSHEWFQMAAKTAPTWKNAVTLQSLERLLEYAPIRFVDRIAPTPLLLVAAEHDFLPLDFARRAFERAGEPKRIVVIPAGHFAPYEPPHFATASSEAIAWFRTHLAVNEAA